MGYLFQNMPRTPKSHVLLNIQIDEQNRVTGSVDYFSQQLSNGNIPKCVDFVVKLKLTDVKSYMKDTTHFIKIMNSLSPLSKNVILFMVDGVNLDMNIVHEECIDCITEIPVKYINSSTKSFN